MEKETIVRSWDFQSPFAKRWNQRYDEAEIPDDDYSFVDALRDNPLEPKRNSIELFLRPYPEDNISLDLEAIIRLCQDVKALDLDGQTKATIWLDDRTYTAYHQTQITSRSLESPQSHEIIPKLGFNVQGGQLLDDDRNGPTTTSASGAPENQPVDSPSARYSPTSRRYKVPLTAKMLYTELKKKRFDFENSPDSDRRVIFVLNPDRNDFLALVETVSQHQHVALRDAIAKFLGFRPSLEISLSTTGIPLYHFSYSLPFFAMRRDIHHRKKNATIPDREWLDLYFIARVLPESTEDGELGIYPAQITVQICGTSAKQYIVYGFEDTDFDPDREFGEDEFSLTDYHADQTAKGELDANRPIWNPREYFLATLKVRSQQVSKEWERLVRTMESAYNYCFPHSFPWNQCMLQLLQRLLPVLEDTIEVWKGFIGPKGDIHYFDDLTSAPCAARIQGTLHDIDRNFDNLATLYRQLLRIQKQCEKEQSSLETRLVLQNNRNTDLMVLYLCPVSMVTSFFGIQKPIMSIQPSGLTFFGLTVLVMAFVQVIRLAMTKRTYRPRWCDTAAIRARGILQGGRANIAENPIGSRVIQRIRTHSWYKKSK
ncbi:hypothetical protein BDW02DRAFT_564779 [Decorospora gaudefroyi]|uniref:Cora-domain-containing protein n=1 Tax=Decorospora gaudefroyi TaxID=184978 RepID=A0A6A5KRE5_9PLEO|nr:hypothetical protein BDW02DRAFT_564779 [Decorospora gaudefroyi]